MRSGIQFLIDYWLNNEGFEEIKDSLMSQINLDEFDDNLKYFNFMAEYPDTREPDDCLGLPFSHWWWFN